MTIETGVDICQRRHQNTKLGPIVILTSINKQQEFIIRSVYLYDDIGKLKKTYEQSTVKVNERLL